METKLETNSFHLSRVKIASENTGDNIIDFLGHNADLSKTHISIIVGANGTSKSRILASIVEQLSDINAYKTDTKSKKFPKKLPTHGLICSELETIQNGESSVFLLDSTREAKIPEINLTLPSKVLVISNLVMDKFHFSKRGYIQDDDFYHYLGVRQATNLTTTGSLGRSVADAVLKILSDSNRLETYHKWTKLVFKEKREVALLLERVSLKEIDEFLRSNYKEALILERRERRSSRPAKTLERVS